MKAVVAIIVLSLFLLTSCTGTPVVTTALTSVYTPPVVTTTAATVTTTPVTTTTPATTSSPPVTLTTTSPATPTPPPTTGPAPTKTPPSTPSAAYEGPLFDTHLHLDQNTLFTRFGSADKLLSFLGSGNVSWAVGFYLLGSDSNLSGTSAMVNATGSSIVPLYHSYNWSQLFSSEQSATSVLQQYLQPKGVYRGVGEIALYQQDLQNVTFNSPAMQAVFKAVNGIKGIVMIHLSTANMGGRETPLSEIEPSVRDYPDTTFLFHGRKDEMKLVSQLMAKYANVYFTIDANDSIFTSKLTGYNLLFPGTSAADTAERFLADLKKVGTQALVQNGLDNLMTLLEAYPDRVLWGTDLSSTWHFDQTVFDAVIKLSRLEIGQIPAEYQEKYAYKNAQALFGRFLTGNH